MGEPIWIDERDGNTLHDRILALDGGPVGVRDADLLQSALARPRQLGAYGERPDIVDMAGAYMAGIVPNQPFFDGNKRTGFVVAVVFLEMNGYRFIAAEQAAARLVLSLAAGTVDDAALGAWMRASVQRL